MNMEIEPIPTQKNVNATIIGEYQIENAFNMEMGLQKPCGSLVFFLPDGSRFKLSNSQIAQAVWEKWLLHTHKPNEDLTLLPGCETDLYE